MTEYGNQYIEVNIHIIPVTVKNTIITNKIIYLTEHELHTCTQIDITSDIPDNPEYIQQKYTITTEL